MKSCYPFQMMSMSMLFISHLDNLYISPCRWVKLDYLVELKKCYLVLSCGASSLCQPVGLNCGVPVLQRLTLWPMILGALWAKSCFSVTWSIHGSSPMLNLNLTKAFLHTFSCSLYFCSEWYTCTPVLLLRLFLLLLLLLLKIFVYMSQFFE